MEVTKIAKFGSTAAKRSLFLFIFFFLVLVSSVSAATPVDGIDYSFDLPFPLFLILLVMGVVLLIAGIVIQNPILGAISLVILLILSFFIMEGNVLIPTGETSYVYGNNFTGYHWDDYNASTAPDQANKEAFLFHEEKEYDNWDNANSSFIGFFMIIGVVVLFFTAFWRDD